MMKHFFIDDRKVLNIERINRFYGVPLLESSPIDFQDDFGYKHSDIYHLYVLKYFSVEFYLTTLIIILIRINIVNLNYHPD